MISQQLIVNICVVLVLLLYGFDLRTHFAFNWILLRDYWLQSTCILSVRILYCMQMGFCFWQFSNEIHIVEILVIYSVLFCVSVHVCGALCKMCIIWMRFFLSIKVILEPRKRFFFSKNITNQSFKIRTYLKSMEILSFEPVCHFYLTFINIIRIFFPWFVA